MSPHIDQYGAWEITDVPGLLSSLVTGKLPTRRDMQELVEWQREHPMEARNEK